MASIEGKIGIIDAKRSMQFVVKPSSELEPVTISKKCEHPRCSLTRAHAILEDGNRNGGRNGGSKD